MDLTPKQPPLLTCAAQMDCRDFQRAYALLRQNRSPLHLPGVRAGLCLTGAGFFLSLLPALSPYPFGRLASVSGAVLLLGLAAWFFLGVPSLEKSRGAVLFESNRTLSLPYTLSIYPDCFLLENEWETILEYWTDVALALESPRYYILCGQLEKSLIVLPKQPLSKEEADRLTEFLQNQLVARYRRVR